MVSPSIRATLTGAAVAVGLFCAAAAAADTPPGQQKCFFIKAWDGWKSPSPEVLYLKVNRNIYRVDLSVGSHFLDAPNMKLVSRFPGITSICTPHDLDLTLTDGRSFRQGLIAERITLLTPDEAAAIPPKYRPEPDPLLVDSSVWIDYFRGVSTRQVERLDALLGHQLLAVGDIILTDVSQRFASEREFREARRLFASLTMVEIVGEAVAFQAARNFRTLRALGVTVRKTVDTLIATRCIEDGLALLYSDRDFDPFVRHLGLQSALEGPLGVEHALHE